MNNSPFDLDHETGFDKTAEVASQPLNDLLYSHADMVRLCDEAKRDQRHACAEALTHCDRDVSGECIWFDEAHQAIMNADV